MKVVAKGLWLGVFALGLLPAMSACSTNCGDGRSNDDDGLADCDDPDCFGHPIYCATERSCADGADNDLDGLTDCADNDCADDEWCQEAGHCGDGRDGDADGLTDCADPDCSMDAACIEAQNCGDGVDNDLDGKTDCVDEDCEGLWPCNEVGLCTNGVDDDYDGLADCLDPDCWSNPFCDEGANCRDDADNDLDGLTDCADDDCSDNPYCTPFVGFWEEYDDVDGPPDIVGHALRFVPDETDRNGYTWLVGEVAQDYLVEPGSGEVSTELVLNDDDQAAYQTQVISSVPFYGDFYDTIFVSTNGYVTFDEASSDWVGGAEAHFDHVGVSLFRANLRRATEGRIWVDEGDSYLAVTYDRLRTPIGGVGACSVQVVFFADGAIEVHYFSLPTVDGIAGISGGVGGPWIPPETDFVP